MQSELWSQAVTYAAIGATQSPDLLRYPPEGYRPIERMARIGHGQARYDWAAAAALSWGIHRNSGFAVELAEAPAEIAELTYTPVSFDESGQPIAPASVARPEEDVFGADGTQQVRAGDTAVLRLPIGMTIPVRVIYVVDEPDRKGFAYGTLAGHPEEGEESWMVEHRSDDSVWMTVRAFSRPASRWWWCVYPVLRIVQEVYTRRYLRSLSGPIT
jgi:uncharacterized protein (UPF0548 family)